MGAIWTGYTRGGGEREGSINDCCARESSCVISFKARRDELANEGKKKKDGK